MKKNTIPYEKQIFVCTYVSEKYKRCGNDLKGESIFKELRRIAKERGLHPRIRVAQTKCLGQCNDGANIMIYPDNVWYSDVQMEDIPSLAEKYLMG